ncbi:helix-turn-helix transcriptional regulator [Flagellimonas myxillae]|uniref:helix-turn-helix transcriptional regulator n=1 Tax=Flagellimonas myxillae TaxID=2942214 RepID=UPI00201EE5F0|nr:helix-turn-helix transcriptional regulator [Muricauda myxillae]MCL6266046.1 helix-turn-helix domain-containing protein [Muricauda myxillae]
MNDEVAHRIKLVIEHYGLSVSTFADAIGVQRSSISHILNGRNRPSLDFVLKVVKSYPEVNLYWLLIGKGSFPANEEQEHPSTPNKDKTEKNMPKGKPEPVRMVVFYADGTFESFDAKK